MRRLVAPAAAIALFMLFMIGTAQRADPGSPFFMWERAGLRGIVKTVVTTDSTTTYAPDGLSSNVRDTTFEWRPNERRIVLGRDTFFTYDAEGYVIHESWVGGRAPRDIRTITYSLLADGGRVGTALDGDGGLHSVTTYNARGLPVDFTQYWLNPLGTRAEYEYNDEGNVVLFHRYDDGGRLTHAWRATYVYDEQGNWVEKTEYAWVSVLGRFEAEGKVERRTITYY